MWSQVPRDGFRYNTAPESNAAMDSDDPHAHSPARLGRRPIGVVGNMPIVGQGTMYNAWVSNRAFPVPASQWPRYGDRRLGCFDRFQEPFMDPTIDSLVSEESSWNHRGARSSREDVPMPDYSSSSSSRAISSMTGSSYDIINVRSMDDEQYNELIQALTPTKPSAIGIRAPSNTPSAVLVTAAQPATVKGKKEGAKEKEAFDETPKKNSGEIPTQIDKQVIILEPGMVTEKDSEAANV